MAHQEPPPSPHTSPFKDPIHQNWTIEELLSSLAHIDSPDTELSPGFVVQLARIERALCESVNAPHWRGTPSTTALIRSITLLCAQTPALRAVPLARALAEDRVPALT